MTHLVEFPMEAIELNIEMSHHPELAVAIGVYLLENPNADFYDKLATVAAYVGIVLDGNYTMDDVRHLCTLCTQKLQERRSILAVMH